MNGQPAKPVVVLETDWNNKNKDPLDTWDHPGSTGCVDPCYQGQAHRTALHPRRKLDRELETIQRDFCDPPSPKYVFIVCDVVSHK